MKGKAMDPKKLWQDQPSDPSKVTMILNRQTRKLHAKTSRDLLGAAQGHLISVLFSIAGIVMSSGFPAVRTASVIALVWGIAGAWVFHRGMWVPPMPGDAGLETGIEFYRQEIQRQRLLFRRWLVWSLGPIVLAIAAFVALPFAVANRTKPGLLGETFPLLVAPFFTLLFCLFIALAAFRKRGKQDLERETAELREIEKESRV